MDVCRAEGKKDEARQPDEEGEYWRCTLIETRTRLRVGRGLGQNETEAAIDLWTHIKRRHAHQDSPPPLVSDGWGGHREALVEVYGHVPPYRGRGRPPTRKQPEATWQYTQMVKQHDDQGHFTGVDIRIIYGDADTLQATGQSTAYSERTNLTARHMNSRLVRQTLGFSKQVVMLRASSIWEDVVYNLTRPVKALRLAVFQEGRRWQPRSPAMVAGLTDHLWSIRELLTRIPVPTNSI
jgi:hypothetical protein